MVEWLLACVGIFMSIMTPTFSAKSQKIIEISELVLYIIMGWLISFAWDDLQANINPYGLNLLIAGGLCYTGGIAFFILGDSTPILHALWHVFVLAATVLHWFVIYQHVLV